MLSLLVSAIMTKKQKQFSSLQLVATAIVIFVAAAGGMYLGKSFNQSDIHEAPLTEDVTTFANLSLDVDSTFPNVTVVDFDINEVGTTSLLSDKNTVVIFIDAECPPCHDKVKHWQTEIDNGNISNDQVIAITFNDLAYIEEFLKKYNVTFGVYSDFNFEFMNMYGVDAYPFEILVDSNGIIKETNFENNQYVEF